MANILPTADHHQTGRGVNIDVLDVLDVVADLPHRGDGAPTRHDSRPGPAGA
jgi:hypothetical protein